MDIPDVEVVIVYGTPSSISQLYQVLSINKFHRCSIVKLNLIAQLFGRAGRDGSKAQAHLFYNKTKKLVDKKVYKFYDPKANPKVCRRKVLLEGVGGEYGGGLELCCDVCSASPIDLTMNLLDSGATTSTRRKGV